MTNKEICVPCEREMKNIESGVVVSERDHDDEPYKLWHADLLECPVCKRKMLGRFADAPFMHAQDEGMEEQTAKAYYTIYCGG